MLSWKLKLAGLALLAVLVIAGFVAVDPPGGGVGEAPRALFDKIVAKLVYRAECGDKCLDALENDKFDIKEDRAELAEIMKALRSLQADVAAGRNERIGDNAFKEFGRRYHELDAKFEEWLKRIKPKVEEDERIHRRPLFLGPAA